MKKYLAICLSLLMLGLANMALAAETPAVHQNLVEQIRSAEFVQGEEAVTKNSQLTFKERLQQQTAAEKMKAAAAVSNTNLPKVAILYVNNAKSTYDTEVDKEIFKYLNRALPASQYELVDGTPYIEKLNKMGYMDISAAERADVMNVFVGENVDYCLYLEIQPFVARDKLTFFTIGKDITTTIPLKIIDLVNNRYIYTGKFTEKASDSTVIGGIGNKSVALKALDNAGQKIESVIETRLPQGKPVKILGK